MVKCCAISGCLNARKGTGLNVFGFPKDGPRLQLWMNSIGSKLRDVDVGSDNYGICSLHFKAGDFTNQNGQRVRLNTHAVPIDSTPLLITTGHSNQTAHEPPDVNDIFKARIASLENSVYNQRRQIERRDSQIVELNSKMESVTAELAKTRKELLEVKKQLSVSSPFEEYVKITYSPAQIKYIQNGIVRSWDPIDISNSIGLYSVSSRAYSYVRNVMKYPLPSTRTLLRWLAKIDIKPGTLKPVLRMLKITQAAASPMERACVLGFDEMSIDPRYCYDSVEDRVYGGEKLMSGLFVRGLFSGWKQLINYSFGEKLNNQDLMDIIRELHDCYCDVFGIVSDLGPKNVGLWKDMDVCKVRKGEFVSKTSIPHPVTGSSIWIFADFPHLLKLLRNHLVDEGLTLPDGTKLGKKLIEELIESMKSELKIVFALTYKHIYSRGKQRQRVRPAFELFSKTVSKAILALFPQRKSEAFFFEQVNNFSDLMNVRTAKSNTNPCKAAYGMMLQDQERFLCDFYHYFKDIRFGSRDKGSYPPFQKAILVSIRSLLGLYNDISQSLRIRYVQTAKLNADYIENTWGYCRGIGHFNLNPNAVAATQRVRRVVIGKNFFHSSKANNEREDDDLLSSNLLQILSQASETKIDETSILSNKLMESTVEIDTEIKPEESNLENLRFSDISEEGGIEYVAGFIAAKFIEKYPYLKRPVCDQTPENALWIRKISDGSLTEPSALWFAQFKKFEEYFSQLHPRNSISKQAGIIKALSDVLTQKFPDIPPDLIKYYARVRTFIRISSLNRQLESQKFKGQEQYRNWKAGPQQPNEQGTLRLLSEEQERLLDLDEDQLHDEVISSPMPPPDSEAAEEISPHDELQNELLNLLEYSNYS